MKRNIETFDFQRSKENFATIVIYQPQWESADWIEKNGLYFLNNPDKTNSIIHEALNASKIHNSSVVILPELAVPESSISIIEEWSISNSTIIIAGSHYFKTQEGYINRTAVITDGSTHYSEKLIPSPLEISPISGESLIPGKKIVVFKNSQIGDFAVLICADYLEDSLTSELTSKYDLDFLFVPAFNQRTQLFHNKMDSVCQSSESGLYQIYCNNILKNFGDGKSAFFGSMDRTFQSKLIGKTTDGIPATKLLQLSNRKQYSVISADLKHKKPFSGKTIHSKSNVVIVFPTNAEDFDIHTEIKDSEISNTDYYERFSEEYIGREDDVEYVLEFLKNPKPKERFLLLYGVGGMGKSHLLSECRERLDGSIPIHKECNHNYDLKTLFQICNIPYPEELKEASAIHQRFLDEFCDRDITLILDDFYEIVDKDVRELLPKFTKISNGKILLLSRIIPKELTQTGLHVNSHEIPPLGKEDFKTIIKNYIQSEGKIVTIADQDLIKIYNKAQGYPLGGQLIVDLLDMEENLDDILKDLPKFQAKRDPEGKEFSGRLLDNIFKKGSREEIDLLCEFSALYEASSINVVKQLPSYDFKAFEALVKRRRFILKEAEGSFHCHAMIKDFAYEKLSEKEAVHDTIGKYYEKILFQNTSLNSEILSKIINHYKRISIRKLKSFGRRVDEKYKIADVKSLIEDNVKDTIRNYESLLLVYPEKMAYWNELGMAYRKSNQKQLAIDTFLKGLKVEPENVRLLNELGITYRENNQKQLAIDTFLVNTDVILYQFHRYNSIPFPPVM